MANPADLFLDDLGSLLLNCSRTYEQNGFTEDSFEYCHRRLEHFIETLQQIDDQIASEATSQLLSEVLPWLTWLESQPISRNACCTNPASICADTWHSGQAGRPNFNIDGETLEFLRDSGFKWTQISNMLGVSKSTIKRRVRDFGLQSRQTFSDISDGDLLELIAQIHGEHVDAGCRMIKGILTSRGIKVTLRRVHEALREVDPILSSQRWGAIVHRRKYSVKGANSLWHIDTHHSLIRWRLIIHGGIDGYSRLITALRCRENNRAVTALDVFMLGIDKYGVPSRVRTDKGSENRMIGEFMIETRGPDRGSFITGPSTHNQRIERLWRDVFRVVGRMFYGFFYWLEENGYLDPTNECHLFALHYVFLPRINCSLKQFEEGWNNHPMRSERNWSPHQMFINSRMELGDDIDDFPDNFPRYGQDWGGLVPRAEESVVEVDETTNPLRAEDIQELQALIPDPTLNCDDFGFQMFVTCRDFVVQCALNNS